MHPARDKVERRHDAFAHGLGHVAMQLVCGVATGDQRFGEFVHLDLGEAAAIALCFSQTADALLVDESLGRAVAARLGLRTIGILGILVEARSQNLIPKVVPVLDRLEQEAGFWIAPALRTCVLQLVGE